MGVMKREQLKDEVEDMAKSLAGVVDLFGEVDSEGQAQGLVWRGTLYVAAGEESYMCKGVNIYVCV